MIVLDYPYVPDNERETYPGWLSVSQPIKLKETFSEEDIIPPKEYCQKCQCLISDYCYGAYFNHNPEEKECPDYEPTTDEPARVIYKFGE